MMDANSDVTTLVEVQNLNLNADDIMIFTLLEMEGFYVLYK